MGEALRRGRSRCLDRRVVLKRRVETLAHEEREAVLRRVVALLNEGKGEAGGRGVSAVGVGGPGPLDPGAGKGGPRG